MLHTPPPRGTISRALVLAALALSAAPAVADTPKRGGTLTIGIGTQSECLDPQQHHHGFGSREGRLLVDSLTAQSAEDAATISPWLATSWQISPDARRYDFTLRSDVTFPDGTPLTAEVIKANFEALSAIPGAAGAEYLVGVTAIEVTDPQHLSVTFAEPNLAFLAAAATSELGIVAPQTLALTADQRCHQGVIGSGPFTLSRVSFNEETILERREGYAWAPATSSNGAEAWLDRLVFKVIPEASVRTGALVSGQVDLTQASYQDAPSLEAAGFTLINAAYVGSAASLFVNSSRPVVQDLAVRRAILKAVDTAEIVQLVQNGYVTAATGVLTPPTPGYLDQSAALANDADAARAILDQAGWIEGPDGIRARDGQRLAISGAFFANAVNQLLFEVIQQQLRDVGIELSLLPKASSAEYLEGQINGDYDVFRWHWQLADPDVLRKDYSSEGLNRLRLEAGANDLDPLLFAQRGLVDPEARRAATDAAQKLIIDQAYAIPLFNPDNLWAARPGVEGVKFGPSGTGGPHILLQDAWLSN